MLTQEAINLRQAKDAKMYRTRARKALEALARRQRYYYYAGVKAPRYIREALAHADDAFYMAALRRTAWAAV